MKYIFNIHLLSEMKLYLYRLRTMFLIKLAACIEALIENNTFVKFKQDMLQYTSLYMINNTLYDVYFDMRISV